MAAGHPSLIAGVDRSTGAGGRGSLTRIRHQPQCYRSCCATGRTSDGALSCSWPGPPVVGLAWILGLLVPYPVEAATSSQVASPRLVDLVAALATGAVGSVALARSDISDTLPGVAIAISLVPPLAVVGLTLESGAPHQALGSLLRFVTNVIAILASGIVVIGLYRVSRTSDESAFPSSRHAVAPRPGRPASPGSHRPSVDRLAALQPKQYSADRGASAGRPLGRQCRVVRRVVGRTAHRWEGSRAPGLSAHNHASTAVPVTLAVCRTGIVRRRRRLITAGS